MSPRTLIAMAACLALVATVPARAQSPTRPKTENRALLLGESYPVEVSITAHAGMLHWLDSLTAMNGTGMTAGKSVPAHRAEFNRRVGRPSPEDQQVLLRYVEARKTSVTQNNQGLPDALTQAFFQAATLGEALDALPALLDPETATAFREVLAHFAPHYQKIWNGGQVARSFVQRVRKDPRRDALAGFLVDVAGFYGVTPATDPPPRLQLVPVIDGYGTHAQAVGRHLLIEVRPWEGLSEQLAPIVHENAHFLFERIDAARLETLRTAAAGEEHGPAAWNALHEALPTAIAQGVAGQRFKIPSWSKQVPWYDDEDIDAYAKALFDLVKRTLAAQGKFDAPFVRQAVALYPDYRPEGVAQ